MNIRSILFDLDGTLLDTNELILRSFEETLEHYYPGRYTREDVLPHMGKTLDEQMVIFGPERVDELVETYREVNARLHEDYVSVFPNVIRVIKQLHDSGIPLAVVTNKRRPMTEAGLEQTGLAPFIDVAICFGDTPEHKPHPAPVLTAIDKLNVHPQSALMVGDSPYDLLAAKRAGVFSAAVSWSIRTEEELRRYEPDVWIDDMRQLLSIVGLASSRR